MKNKDIIIPPHKMNEKARTYLISRLQFFYDTTKIAINDMEEHQIPIDVIDIFNNFVKELEVKAKQYG